jgi:hypothetical protein
MWFISLSLMPRAGWLLRAHILTFFWTDLIFEFAEITCDA